MCRPWRARRNKLMEIVEQKQGGVLIVGLKGRLDATNSTTTQDRIVALIDAGSHQVVIDLSGLDYISSAGLRIFLMAGKKLKASNGKIALFGLQPPIHEIFEIAGFVGLFPICASREAAITTVQ